MRQQRCGRDDSAALVLRSLLLRRARCWFLPKQEDVSGVGDAICEFLTEPLQGELRAQAKENGIIIVVVVIDKLLVKAAAITLALLLLHYN